VHTDLPPPEPTEPKDNPVGPVPAKPVDYGGPPPGYVSARRYRLVLWLTLTNTVMLLAFVVVPFGWNQAERRWEQHLQRLRDLERTRLMESRRLQQVATRRKVMAIQQACLNYSPPPEQVVYEEDPEKARELASESKRHKPFPMSAPAGTPSRWHPPVADQGPPEWEKVRPLSSRQWAANVLFLHELVSPSGTRRLVHAGMWRAIMVSITADEPSGLKFDCDCLIEIAAVKPTTEDEDIARGTTVGVWVRRLRGDVRMLPPLADAKSEPMRIFAGQLDPRDRSHFALPIEIGNRKGVLDVRLGDDGSLTVKPTFGALLPTRSLNQFPGEYSNLVWDPYATTTSITSPP